MDGQADRPHPGSKQRGSLELQGVKNSLPDAVLRIRFHCAGCALSVPSAWSEDLGRRHREAPVTLDQGFHAYMEATNFGQAAAASGVSAKMIGTTSRSA